MDELSVEQVAALRAWIRNASSAGHSMGEINASLNQKYPGVTSDQVMKMSGQDFARSMAQGLTLNHAPAIAGMVAKLKGGDYSQGRDQFREEDNQAMAANPGLNTTVRALSGAIPGAVAGLVPGIAPVEGAHVANMVRGALGAGATGAIAGEGASTSPTTGGVLKDAATVAIPSAIVGGLGGGLASKLATRGLPSGTAGKIEQEGAALLPANKTTDEIRQMVGRQEMLAPGTVVGADLSPGLQKMASGVGADMKTAMKASSEAMKRHAAVKDALDVVGQGYDALKGITAPSDPDILGAVAATGKKIPVKGGQIDLSHIQSLRSDLLRKARMTNDKSNSYDLRQLAKPLTDWLGNQYPPIKGIDSDYAFLTGKLADAAKTMKILQNSAANYGVQRAYGAAEGSVGGSIPGVPLPGGTAGTVVRTLAKALSPADRAARAQAVYGQFLTPIRGTDLLEHLLNVHEALSQPRDASLLNAGASALFKGAVPSGAAALASQ